MKLIQFVISILYENDFVEAAKNLIRLENNFVGLSK